MQVSIPSQKKKRSAETFARQAFQQLNWLTPKLNTKKLLTENLRVCDCYLSYEYLAFRVSSLEFR